VKSFGKRLRHVAADLRKAGIEFREERASGRDRTRYIYLRRSDVTDNKPAKKVRQRL
jgi:hypothetical protein